MSKHHANCTKPAEGIPVESKKHRNQHKPLLSKPFCDCQQCLCNNCPDILKMFSITVTEKSCDFGSKVTKDKNKNPKKISISEDDSNEISDLLNVMKDGKDCNCEVASRALRSNVHKNIGLPERGTGISIQDPEVPTPDNQ